MSKLIIVDAGHGKGTQGKRTPTIAAIKRYIPEWEGNQLIAGFLCTELKRCGFDAKRVDDVTGVTDVSLIQRTNAANSLGAAFYISCHHNAGGGTGLETFSYPGSTKSLNANKLIHDELMKSGVPRKNRGVKTANFHVLRETRMPAVLVEYGFMDGPEQEALDMLNEEIAKKQAIATAKGICRFFSVSYVPEHQAPPQPQTPKLPMQRIEIDGNVVVDSQVESVLLETVKKNLGKHIIIKPRE